MKRLIFSHDEDDKMISPKIEQQKSNEWRNLGISSGHMFYVEAPSSYIGKCFFQFVYSHNLNFIQILKEKILLIGRTYNNLYGHLTRDHKAIPLGLYRGITHKNGPHNYIYINPERNTIV